jgi:predicted nucleic acid-binding protein
LTVKPPGPIRLFCDANVLYASVLRNLLIRLALADVLELRWSSQVQQEWVRNLLDHQPTLDASRLKRTCALMEHTLPGACVSGYETRLLDLILPDPDDLHVLAAALHGRASYLLTFNLRDFPAAVLAPLGLQALHPDVWLHTCLQQHPAELLKVLAELSADLKQPPLSVRQVAQALEQSGLPVSCAALLALLDASEEHTDL